MRNVAEEFWMTLIFLQHARARVRYFHLLRDVKKIFSVKETDCNYGK